MFRILKQLIATISILAFLATSSHAMFIQPDWYDPSHPGVGTNRYSYSFNDPINKSDPGGNCVAGCAGDGALVSSGPLGWAVLGVLGAITLGAYVYSEMTAPQSGVSVGDGILTMDGLIGEQDSEAGPRGGRHVSGPLTPENGGTGHPEHDWEVITGGDYVRDPNSGHLIGPNGERYRPGKTGEGPRIDIPASGDKPHETLHYPEREETEDADSDEDRTDNE